ncbi:MAG: S26 family signal peptidase [Gammaproteobacteria bacterium]|nr:S26 family signal peptidase [Gammaproteobacteria bacterium]
MKKVLRVTTNVILISLLIVTIGLFVLRISGSGAKINSPVHVYEILTGSMEPTLHKQSTYKNGKKKTGDVVLVIKTKIEKLKEGDIVSYYTDINNDGKYEVVTHRLVSIENNKFRIVGDAEGSLDETLTLAQMNERFIGKVAFNHKLYVVTILYRFICTIYGFLLLIVLPLTFLIGKEIYTLIKTMKAPVEENESGVTYNGVTFSEEEIKKMIKEKEEKENEKE